MQRSWSVFDLSAQENAVNALETQAGDPVFWDDHQSAQRKMQELGRLKDTVSLWRGIEGQGNSLLELTELAIAEDDFSLEEQLTAEVAGLARDLAREEIVLTLSGPYDQRPAIVSIHAGAGGTDSQDWAQMLVNMYSRWAEVGKRPMEVLDLTYGDDAGLRSGTIEVGGQSRLRLSDGRTGGAPSGAPVPLRPQPPASHFLRSCRGAAHRRE